MISSSSPLKCGGLIPATSKLTRMRVRLTSTGKQRRQCIYHLRVWAASRACSSEALWTEISVISGSPESTRYGWIAVGCRNLSGGMLHNGGGDENGRRQSAGWIQVSRTVSFFLVELQKQSLGNLRTTQQQWLQAAQGVRKNKSKGTALL